MLNHARCFLVLLVLLMSISCLSAEGEGYADIPAVIEKIMSDNGMADMYAGFKKHFNEQYNNEAIASKSGLISKVAANPASALPEAGKIGDELVGLADKNDLRGILNAVGRLWGNDKEVTKEPFKVDTDPIKLVNTIYELVELAGNDAIIATNRALFKNDRFVTLNKLGTTIHRLMENVFINHDASEKLGKALSKTKAQIWIDVTTTLRESDKVDHKLLLEGLMTLASLNDPQVLDDIAKVLNGHEWGKPDELDGVEGSVFFCKKYSAGRVIIGGRGKTIYKKPAALIIDLGGNDEYEFCASSQDNIPCSIVIDFDGNDKYTSSKFEGRTVGGMLGISILIDRKGMDTYECPTIGLGAGIYGASLLIDEEGRDKYIGGEFSCGAGMYGIGILWDKDGDDSYTTGMFSCGFGGPGGIGLLLDTKGNDTFKSIGSLPALDKSKLNCSFAQGFGLGFHPLRPDGGDGTLNASGGIGLLIDCKGDDSYDAGYCAQGSSFYRGLGILFENDGNDKYKGGSFCQGSAIYGGIGVLLEKAGNEIYTTNGYYSQGCAYDGAVGILCDFAGRDSYNGEEYCQGCTSQNGMALLFDLSGADAYKAKTFSHGEIGTEGEHFEEDWPSIAMLCDFGGDRNSFSGSGRVEGTNFTTKCVFFLTLKKSLLDALKESLKVQ